MKKLGILHISDIHISISSISEIDSLVEKLIEDIKKVEVEKERQIMSNSNSSKIMVPNAREAMNKFKMEAASDLAVSAPS